MTEARLEIGAAAYSLLIRADAGWRPLAALAGGAGALLRGDRAVDELALERAIQIVEDWLMPHAARLAGCTLIVQDGSGRLADGLGAVLAVGTARWSVADIEAMFNRVVALATGRHVPPALAHRQAFVADLLLLRELAHHGRLAEVRLETPGALPGAATG